MKKEECVAELWNKKWLYEMDLKWYVKGKECNIKISDDGFVKLLPSTNVTNTEAPQPLQPIDKLH